jgi:hypothetical protein
MKHYLAILLITDSSPHINDETVKWHMDPNVILMNKEIWKKYFKSVEEIFPLFMQFDNNLEDNQYILDIENNILKVKGLHSITPGATILTLRSMLCLKYHFTFDYVVRATTSTFWVLPKLKNMLINLPKSNLYKGWIVFNSFIRGSNMIFSKDVVTKLIDSTYYLLNKAVIENIADDVLFGGILPLMGVPLTDMKICNFEEKKHTLDEIDRIIKEYDIDDVCCYRVKVAYENRLVEDSIIFNRLYDYFYGSTK